MCLQGNQTFNKHNYFYFVINIPYIVLNDETHSVLINHL